MSGEERRRLGRTEKEVWRFGGVWNLLKRV